MCVCGGILSARVCVHASAYIRANIYMEISVQLKYLWSENDLSDSLSLFFFFFSKHAACLCGRLHHGFEIQISLLAHIASIWLSLGLVRHDTASVADSA